MSTTKRRSRRRVGWKMGMLDEMRVEERKSQHSFEWKRRGELCETKSAGREASGPVVV